MQIDFHFAATYVLARFAGFDAAEADVIAHSAQYVDDATQAGEVQFDNGMRFARISSAHRMLDYSNLDPFGNRSTWLPFHFLPGNRGEEKPSAPVRYEHDEFIDRCICRPDSPLSREMMQSVIERQDRPYALYRLGIALHVYVDTWAHQGFVGFSDAANIAHHIEADDDHHAISFVDRLERAYKGTFDNALGLFIGGLLPLGHGAALSYPDRPYLVWSYLNQKGDKIERNNTTIFTAAAAAAYRELVRYRDYKQKRADVFTENPTLPAQFPAFVAAMRETRDEDPDIRLSKWLGYIGDGRFGFQDRAGYIDKGPGSWKALALGTELDIGTKAIPLRYRENFPQSHWKNFHDALMAHQFYVLHELLPAYGLLAA